MGADLSKTESFDYVTSQLDQSLTFKSVPQTTSVLPPWLVIFRLGGSTQTIELQVQERMLFGRLSTDPTKTIDLTPYGANGLGVSRRHALIFPHKTNLVVRDLNSTNGTFINGYRLPANADYPLQTNDLLEIGKLGLHIELAVPMASKS